MGYPFGKKGWHFFNPTNNKFILSRDATFDAQIFLFADEFKNMEILGVKSSAQSPTKILVKSMLGLEVPLMQGSPQNSERAKLPSLPWALCHRPTLQAQL